ncbi:hypothetical protein ACVXZ4_11185 [Lacisediminihabitans sp. FW035]
MNLHRTVHLRDHHTVAWSPDLATVAGVLHDFVLNNVNASGGIPVPGGTVL